MDDLERLYRQHASAVFRFAWGLSGDRSCAEDIVSATFLRLLTNAPRIETQTALAYLLAAARNTYLTGRRRRAREVDLTEDVLATEVVPVGRLAGRAQLAADLSSLANVPHDA